MTKQEFLCELKAKLCGLPAEDVSEHITFYSEMVDDRIEEGLTEDEAVAAVGSADDIAAQIIADTHLSKIAIEKIKPKKQLGAGTIVLLLLGSPIWLSLLIAVFAVILSLCVSLWAVIISAWAVFISLAACFVGGVAVCVILTIGGNGASGLAAFAAGLICSGLSIFAFYGCKAVTVGTFMLTKKIAIWIKNCFIKKEGA